MYKLVQEPLAIIVNNKILYLIYTLLKAAQSRVHHSDLASEDDYK